MESSLAERGAKVSYYQETYIGWRFTWMNSTIGPRRWWTTACQTDWRALDE